MPVKILMVDDSDTVRQEFSAAFTDGEYEVILAHDGKHGSRLLEEQSDIDVIFSDLNMPIWNGIDLLKFVRKNPKYAEIPFIMLSAIASKARMKEAKELGATGWIVKPPNMDSVKKYIHKLLESKGQKAS